jgi:hypothetical protein
MQETGPNKPGRFLPTNTTSSHWFAFIRWRGRGRGSGKGEKGEGVRDGEDQKRHRSCLSHLHMQGNVDVKMKN